MLCNAKNGTLSFPDSTMDYVRFGSGSRTLVLLPGLGDGLRSMKGMALPMAVMYRKFTRDYTVYVFSRKNHLPQGCTTRDMARDQKLAMDMLGIEKADIAGVSMGGMIAQHLAAEHPEKVNKLVLAVTSPRPNPILKRSVSEWIGFARQGDHTGLMDSNVRLIYSDEYYRNHKWMVPITGRLTKPKTYDRFFIQAEACLTHDAYDRLSTIAAPTLVVGGQQDRCLGGDASREIAAAIPGARLKLYPQWGHGLYDEEKDFIPTVLDFLIRTTD